MLQIGDFLHQHPEFALFLSIAIGYGIGTIKIRGYGIGPIIGTLIIALTLGQIPSSIPLLIPPALQTVFLLLFMFATGYFVGPQFFIALRRPNRPLTALSLLFCVTGLGCSLLAAYLAKFDAGLALGLFSGALTQSSAIGTAMDATAHLNLSIDVQHTLGGHMVAAHLVTYIFGALGVSLFLTKIAPALFRLNPSTECAQMARALGAGTAQHAHSNFEIYTAIELKAYRINPERWNGFTVQELVVALPPRVFLQRLRRGERTFYPRNNLLLRAGDIVALSGTRELLLPLTALVGEDIIDPDSMEIPFETLHVVINNRDIHGLTIAELVRANPKRAQGIHLRSIRRQGQYVPRLPNTRIERGDVFELVGRHEDLQRALPILGAPEHPTEKTDLLFVGITCALGIIIGTLLFPLNTFPLRMGTSCGVLIAGLCFGWFHAARPRYGRIPEAAVWLMRMLGLNLFIASIGLAGAPFALGVIKTQGVSLILFGILVTLLPHLTVLFVGRKIFKMNAGVLLGVCAGAGTAIPALHAIQDKAGSEIPVLGFTLPYALNIVIMTLCGPIIIGLMS